MASQAARWLVIAALCAAVAFVGVQALAGEGNAKPAPADTTKAADDTPKTTGSGESTMSQEASDRLEHMKEMARNRIDKQLETIQKEFSDVRLLDSKTNTEVLQIQVKATENLNNADNAADINNPNKKPRQKPEVRLSKGEKSDALLQYRDACILCAMKLLALDAKYAALNALFKPLDYELERLGADAAAYKDRINNLSNAIWLARRANLERVALFYKSVASYENAIQVYTAILDNMPAENRDPNDVAKLNKTISDLKKKLPKKP